MAIISKLITRFKINSCTFQEKINDLHFFPKAGDYLNLEKFKSLY